VNDSIFMMIKLQACMLEMGWYKLSKNYKFVFLLLPHQCSCICRCKTYWLENMPENVSSLKVKFQTHSQTMYKCITLNISQLLYQGSGLCHYHSYLQFLWSFCFKLSISLLVLKPNVHMGFIFPHSLTSDNAFFCSNSTLLEPQNLVVTK
jgi:hypothetical protein